MQIYVYQLRPIPNVTNKPPSASKAVFLCQKEGLMKDAIKAIFKVILVGCWAATALASMVYAALRLIALAKYIGV